MKFPKAMLSARRWTVRPEGKVPISAHETRPYDYEPEPGESDTYWRFRWNRPEIWADFGAALSFKERHFHEGLSFVVHPGEETERAERIICIDFDNCFDANGELDPVVADLVEILDTFSEYSRSRRGLHVFLTVETLPFTNLLQKPFGRCKVDVLCSSQVAVTGEPYHFAEVATISYRVLEGLPFFEFRPVVTFEDDGGLWEDDVSAVSEENAHLVDMMRDWPEAIEGLYGSKKLFAAACRLLEHGVKGHEAELLLEELPAFPPFSQSEIRRVIECAYPHVVADGGLNTKGVKNEFGRVEGSGYGFDPVPVDELLTMDLELKFLIEGLFVGEGALFVGGQEKCFKTGITFDLIMSLASGSDFLGRFPVNDLRSSVVFTAEIGMPTCQALVKRIMRAKGLESLSGFDVVDSVPALSVDKRTGKPANPAAICGLKRYFDEKQPEIAVFDPLYFAMSGTAVGDMYEIGGTLRHISEICKSYGIWPIFCHHSRKAGKDDEAKPMEISDLYGSGVGAYARQWILLAHAEPFRRGVANLWATIGGSATGGRGVWRIKLDEGQPDDILDRGWSIHIENDDEAAEPDDITHSSIIGALETLSAYEGRGAIGAADLSFFMRGASKGQIENVLRDLIKAGKVGMYKGKQFFLKG